MRRPVAGVALALLVSAATVSGQSRPDLRIAWEDGTSAVAPLRTDRGYAAVPAGLLMELGWAVRRDTADVVLRGPSGTEVRLRPGTPFLRWDGQVLQMVDAPYEEDGALLVPAQLLTDFLPRRLPELYAFEGPAFTLRSATRLGGDGDGAGRGGPEARDAVVTASVAPPPSAEGGRVDMEAPSEYDGVRVVIIDAGHGGRDPGSVSASGIREKTVALGVARALAARLRDEADLEVRMIRDDDTFVPLWDRGALATEMKGDRPGVFLSIHANSFSSRARGFETYFLSEARTEHEERVAAIENAPLRLEEGEVDPADDLGFILGDLRNLDHAHWSAFLAEYVQEEVDRVHPGPNRGVKQAPLAVITNALMPSVLVEIGYLSHPEEARLLARPDFQREAGEAIARAVLSFFERYPPGSWTRTGEGR